MIFPSKTSRTESAVGYACSPGTHRPRSEKNKRVETNVEYSLLDSWSNWSTVMKAGVVITDCVLSITVSTVRESLGKLRFRAPLYFRWVSDRDVFNVHCKYRNYLTSWPTRHRHQTPFHFRATPFSGLVPSRPAVEIEARLVCGDCIRHVNFFLLIKVPQIAREIHYTHP